MIVNNLNKIISNKTILSDLSFELHKSDKVGLIGANGSGKSTLLKILAGELDADSGIISGNERIGYLKQEIPLKDYSLSILDFLLQETGIGSLEKQLHELENNLSDSNMDQYNDTLERFLLVDGYNFSTNVDIILSGLAINKSLETKIGQLSGGEKIKVLLAGVLLGNYDTLLLDEPTNNLDLQSVDFLQSYINSLNSQMIIVSHDEKFLDSVTDKTFELKDGKITEFSYSYSKYLENKELKYNKEYSDYLGMQAKKKALINRIAEAHESVAMSKSNSAHKPKDNNKMGRDYKIGRGENKSGALIKSLNKELDETSTPTSFRIKETYNFKIDSTKEKPGSKDIYIRDLVCGYDNFSTTPISLSIPYGERLLVAGENGSGKTTFIKTLLSTLPVKSGYLDIGKGLTFGYLEQNTVDDNQSGLSMYEYITDGMESPDKSLVFTVLNNFKINYEDRNKPFNSFSSGERTKINLAKLSINMINALILDEPTNHLDIDASNILYDALDSFEGTIIAISHNTTLVERLNPNRLLDIKTGIISSSEYPDPSKKRRP